MKNFIDNKYSRWYFSIVNKAKLNLKIDFYEKHHIIPKCLGGSNDQENLVKLTYRQHFVCHLLLTKMVEGKAKYHLIHAMYMMCASTKKHSSRNGVEVKRLTSRWFSYFKRLRKETGVPQEVRDKMSKGMIGKNLGKTRSLETKAKISSASKNRVVSDQTKEKISNRLKKEWESGIRSNVGKKRSETRSKNWSPPMSGKKHSEETRKRMSDSAKKIIHKERSSESIQKQSITVSKLKWINDGVSNKRVNELDLANYLRDGWLLGRYK